MFVSKKVLSMGGDVLCGYKQIFGYIVHWQAFLPQIPESEVHLDGFYREIEPNRLVQGINKGKIFSCAWVSLDLQSKVNM